ncbi:sensor histidine kinase [Ulvibacterium marinum]|uniref:histidine kinase n=1 Tax=Ulvibacterium marinum TaxID=2419782 RepID=A0A3B0C4U2_9FLAO|nr:HAMP domain-containing sensor histidine kinase [Ulvibacterium marinum]RKN79671.1 sensor histidine kinase [Ulvibacterium marinum]
MNLVRKTNTYYLIFLAFLFPIMVTVDYYLIQYIVNSEVEEILLHESERINFHLVEEGTFPASNYLFETTPVSEDIAFSPKFKDTLFYEAYADKRIPYRTYEFIAQVHSQNVRISLKHVLLEINELILLLFVTTTLVLLVLVTGLFFINQKIYRWAWSPFFKNLTTLNNYDVAQKQSIHLEPSNILEFEELNKVVTSLIDQVKKDFQNLKEFNQNISHEIQTPLAIIRNKIVLLLESQNLDSKELQWVQAVYQETNKLSKIEKSLTLISRIENQEFKRLDSVDVRLLIENIMNNMIEMITFKKLKVKTNLNPVKIKCDLVLADILFTNLIKNAVQHNHEGGSIEMFLSEEKFEIINTGDESLIETAQLFNRFQKGNASKESLGLGLAINQRICELYGFRLDYNRQGRIHTFSLFFQ